MHVIAQYIIDAWRQKGWRVVTRAVLGPEVEAEKLMVTLLPAGAWPRDEGGGTELPNTPSSTPVEDLGRFQFLRTLGPVREFVGLRGLGSDYRAFDLRTASGRRVVLADVPRYGNALYAFDGEGDWLSAAALTRFQLKTLRPPEYIRKITHHTGWESRVLELLQTS